MIMRLTRTMLSATAVGGTNDIPEVAVFFSGGGFSDYVRLFPVFVSLLE